MVSWMYSVNGRSLLEIMSSLILLGTQRPPLKFPKLGELCQCSVGKVMYTDCLVSTGLLSILLLPQQLFGLFHTPLSLFGLSPTVMSMLQLI